MVQLDPGCHQLHPGPLKPGFSGCPSCRKSQSTPGLFFKTFFQYTGIRPLACLHEKRIERAQYLLTTTNMSYVEVATETGFENLPYFSRFFKKVTSLTPVQYKQQNKLD
ncbi:helix-turn-helix domain-containing protein [Paraflavisolibacter caeni]|jgi:transcriptional regulator GlxA family with amidase domain|uniref:helix-turn-helix domain-containing protein n=1 Tax=Paraflavisolibacter caeni TaxID=2982496 RepID=UPI002433BE21|nr:helix-turn-helix domain-containing protein [Paraflavisolibacter caeni]